MRASVRGGGGVRDCGLTDQRKPQETEERQGGGRSWAKHGVTCLVISRLTSLSLSCPKRRHSETKSGEFLRLQKKSANLFIIKHTRGTRASGKE